MGYQPLSIPDQLDNLGRLKTISHIRVFFFLVTQVYTFDRTHQGTHLRPGQLTVLDNTSIKKIKYVFIEQVNLALLSQSFLILNIEMA